MVDSLPSEDTGTQKRRSTRIVQAVPVTVSGVDALGQPFKERTTTVMVNLHGCKYQSKHYVPKNSTIKLEIPHTDVSLPARIVLGRVVWVQRPRAVRELFQIGLEFETAGNVWGIAFPPEDWLHYSEDQPSEVPAQPESVAEFEIRTSAQPAPGVPETGTDAPIAPPAAGASDPQGTPTTATPPAGDSKIHLVPGSAPAQDVQLAAAREMAKMVASAKETLDKTLRRGAQTAINEEMTIVRQQLDAQAPRNRRARHQDFDGTASPNPQ